MSLRLLLPINTPVTFMPAFSTNCFMEIDCVMCPRPSPCTKKRHFLPLNGIIEFSVVFVSKDVSLNKRVVWRKNYLQNFEHTDMFASTIGNISIKQEKQINS